MARKGEVGQGKATHRAERSDSVKGPAGHGKAWQGEAGHGKAGQGEAGRGMDGLRHRLFGADRLYGSGLVWHGVAWPALERHGYIIGAKAPTVYLN